MAAHNAPGRIGNHSGRAEVVQMEEEESRHSGWGGRGGRALTNDAVGSEVLRFWCLQLRLVNATHRAGFVVRVVEKFPLRTIVVAGSALVLNREGRFLRAANGGHNV